MPKKVALKHRAGLYLYMIAPAQFYLIKPLARKKDTGCVQSMDIIGMDAQLTVQMGKGQPDVY